MKNYDGWFRGGDIGLVGVLPFLPHSNGLAFDICWMANFVHFSHLYLDNTHFISKQFYYELLSMFRSLYACDLMIVLNFHIFVSIYIKIVNYWSHHNGGLCYMSNAFNQQHTIC